MKVLIYSFFNLSIRLGWESHALALPLGKRYSTHCTRGWMGPRANSNGRRKLGFDPRTIQPAASRYVDCTVTAHNHIVKGKGTDPKAQKGGRGIDLLFLDLSARRGWVVSTTPRPLYPQERPGTHCMGGWVGPRAGMDMCKKFFPHWDLSPGPSSP
jgi:hypothetical protein